MPKTRFDMKIITIPHQTLRQKAKVITKIDKQVLKFVKDLEQTLKKSSNPKGAGLAAPQVNKLWRVFATQVSRSDKSRSAANLRVFLNPVISDHSTEQTLGPDPKDPTLEGCLSLPNLWGPIPRWEWVRLDYQIIENSDLIDQSERFSEFFARVIQHELDHLDGVLFTDYSLEHNLPVYQEINNKFVEIEDRTLLKVF